MSLIGDKLNLLRDFCQKSGLDLSFYLLRYRGQMFNGTSLDKFELFRGILTNLLTAEGLSYVDRMLNISHRDRRTAVEYGADLVLGWLIEDVVADAFCLKLSGSDSGREFLPIGKITNLTDFKLGERPVELMVDWGSYWMDLGRIHFRHDKLIKLTEERALVLGFAIRCGKFFVMDLTKKIDFRKEYNPRQGKYCSLVEGYDSFLNMAETRAELEKFR